MPLTGKWLTFTLNGKSAAATTNISGQRIYHHERPDNIWHLLLSVAFAGHTSTYNASTTSANLIVV